MKHETVLSSFFVFFEPDGIHRPEKSIFSVSGTTQDPGPGRKTVPKSYDEAESMRAVTDEKDKGKHGHPVVTGPGGPGTYRHTFVEC